MTELIGRFHPLLVHLPIGILLLAIVFEWLTSIKKFKFLKKSVRIILWIGFASAAFSCLTGYLLSQSGDYESNAVELHQWAAIALTILAFTYAWARMLKSLKRLYKFLSVLTLVLLMITGHLGGTLTHGENFLFAGLSSDEEIHLSTIDLQQAHLYEDLVKPILQDKCYTCHGTSKQKGKLRLDLPENILKGGKNGVVLVGGNVDESEMIDRLLLPLDDEDHMPPNEKKQLSHKEIEVLKIWIASGADFKKTVVELSLLTDLKNILQESKKETLADVPEEIVSPANENVLARLRNMGVVILPVSVNSNYLSANFINATALDSAINLISQLKEQIVWLKLSDQPISDKNLGTLSLLKNVRKLWLDHTAVSDAGLQHIISFRDLLYLNLNGTKVTATGVQILQPLNHLRDIYLFETTITNDQLQFLQTKFPNTHLEIGNYTVPTLSTDTTTLKSPPN